MLRKWLLLVGAALGFGACSGGFSEFVSRATDPTGFTNLCLHGDKEACRIRDMLQHHSILSGDPEHRIPFVYASLKIAHGAQCNPSECNPHVLGECITRNGITIQYNQSPRNPALYEKFCLADCVKCGSTLAKHFDPVPITKVPMEWW